MSSRKADNRRNVNVDSGEGNPWVSSWLAEQRITYSGFSAFIKRSET
jgi:hypothetical protein